LFAIISGGWSEAV
jgi:hypothetical protein